MNDGLSTPREDLGALQRLLELQAEVLRCVVTDAPTSTLLALLCREIEVAFPACTPTILVLDESGTALRVAARDRLPDSDCRALESLPVPKAIIASDQARTQAVDLAPRSELWPRLGVSTGDTEFASTWSTALLDADGATLGELVMFWHDSPALSAQDQATIQSLAGLIVSALLRHRHQQQGLALVTNERNRIAGELHDDSVQAITAVALRLQRLRGRLTDPEQRNIATEALEGANEAVERMRGMLFDLHPITLGEDGLVLTFRSYFEDQVQPFGVQCDVLGDESLRAPTQIEATAFRLSREAIGNALKHGKPSHISVSVEYEPTSLVVVIDDDGAGFDVAAEAPRPGHIGMHHVAALAASAGGSYQIQSTPGRGTKVTISLPIMLPSTAASR